MPNEKSTWVLIATYGYIDLETLEEIRSIVAVGNGGAEDTRAVTLVLKVA